jgi:hypothetical protein
MHIDRWIERASAFLSSCYKFKRSVQLSDRRSHPTSSQPTAYCSTSPQSNYLAMARASWMGVLAVLVLLCPAAAAEAAPPNGALTQCIGGRCSPLPPCDSRCPTACFIICSQCRSVCPKFITFIFFSWRT